MIKNVFFDLDGTLLPMDQDIFTKTYFKKLAAKLAPYGYEADALIDGIWAGMAAMVENDGSRKNEEAFWEKFSRIFGERVFQDMPLFDEYYRYDFNEAKQMCGVRPEARELVDWLKARGCRVVLATNPIFPAIATENRIRWAGLCPEDFELYTTYENSRYCKPNPKYYETLLSELSCRAEETLMVGNDVEEDMVAETVGMKVFLLTDCLISRAGRDISCYPNGDFQALKRYLEENTAATA